MAKNHDAKSKTKHSNKPLELSDEPTLTKAEQEELDARPYDDDTLPNEAVSDAVSSSRELAKSAAKLAPRLLAKSELDADALVELERRADVLERAEARWQSARKMRANPALVKMRVEGEATKTQTMRTLRYFLRQNPEVQSRLDVISHGSGDDDLADDLRKLAALVHTHRVVLVKAADELGKAPQARLRALAASIQDASQDQRFDATAEDALSLRNRAFWNLDELDAEVRAAGRYVFANEPKRLAVFLLRDTSSQPFVETDDEGDAERAGEEEDEEDTGDEGAPAKEAGGKVPAKAQSEKEAPKGKATKPGGKKGG